MNQPFKSFVLWLCGIGCCIGICLLACNGPADKKGIDIDSLLQQPPFTTLTDSIRRAVPADAAGLYFRRGELLSRNNLHEIAAADYKRSWELHPQEETGLHYASTLSIIGRADEATQLLRDCIKRFPSDNSFSSLLGDIYVQTGKMREARQLYDDLLSADTTNFEAWYEKGLLLEKANDTAGAITALRKAYTLQPVNTYALELAHLYAEKGNAAALQLCDEVLRKDSTKELIDPLFIKGIYYSNTGQNESAIIQFDSCIRRDWKFTDAYLEKGIIVFHQKKYEEALKVFQMATTVSNTYPDAYYWLGRCYEATGKKEEAIIYYQQALALDKDFSEAKDRMNKLKG